VVVDDQNRRGLLGRHIIKLDEVDTGARSLYLRV
jgi:hypothetical protein